jgi:hypothetical protein
MIDLADIESGPGALEWMGIVRGWRKSKLIDKQEVLKLLRSGVPVPAYAAEFLADALDDDVEFEFKRGNKPWYPRSFLYRAVTVMHQVRTYEGWIKDPATLPEDTDKESRQTIESLHRRTKRQRGKRTTPNKAAVALTGEYLELKARHVRSKITEFNKGVKRFAEKHGCTVQEARDYFLK